MRERWFLALLGVCTLCGATVVAQQSQGTGGLQLLVRDEFAGAVAGAAVTVTGPQGYERAIATNVAGEVTLDGLVPGTYTAKVESPGFDPRQLNDIRVAADGRVARTVELKITAFAASVDVVPNARSENLRESS